MIPVPLLSAIAVAGFIYWRSTMGSAPSSGNGWSSRSGVVLTPAMAAFLDRLAAESGVTLDVTSGVRSPEAQARAMSGKVSAGSDRTEMMALYHDGYLSEIWPPGTEWSESRAVQVLRSQMARGIYLSRHMRGDAFDLSVRNLSTLQQYAVRDAAIRLGAEAIIESEPAHIHIENVT